MRARPHRFPRLEEDFACRLTVGARQGDPCGAPSRAALTGDAAGGEGSRNSRRRCAMFLTALSLTLAALPSLGHAETLSVPLAAANYSLATPRAENDPIATIWVRELPAIRADRAALLATNANLRNETELFTASIKVDGATYLLSAFNFHCTSSVATPQERDCPAKLAKIENGKVVSVRDLAAFPIAAVRGERGYSGFDPKTHTTFRFDTATASPSYEVFVDGQSEGSAPLN